MCRILVWLGAALCLSCPPDLSAQTVLKTINGVPGGFLTKTTVDPVTDRVFVAGALLTSSPAALAVIDGATNEVHSVSLPAPPVDIAILGHKAYVTTTGPQLAVVDTVSLAVNIVTLSNPASGIAVNPVTKRVFVSEWDSGVVLELDADTDTVAGSLGPLPTPAGLAVNPLSNKVYVLNAHPTMLGGSNSVTVFDIDSGTTPAAILPLGSKPYDVAVNPVTNRIYIVSSGGTLTVIDGATNTTTAVSIGTNPVAVAVNPATNKIYVANQGFVPGASCCILPTGDVAIVDGATNTVTHVGSGVIRNPEQVLVNPFTNQVYVRQNPRWPGIFPIDAATGTVGAQFGFLGTSGIAINPVTNRLYDIRNGIALDVIDLDTNKVDTIAAGSGSALGGHIAQVVANPLTGKAYVTSSSAPTTVTIVSGIATPPVTLDLGRATGGLALNPATNKVYATQAQGTVEGTAIAVIDGTTNTASSVPLPLNAPTKAIVVNAANNRIFVLAGGLSPGGQDILYRLDGTTHAIVGSQEVPPNLGPLVVNEATNQLYAFSFGGTAIWTIDGATLSLTAMSTGGAVVTGMAVNPLTNRIYAAESGQGFHRLRIIDGTTFTSSTIDIGTTPAAVAVNRATNTIYVTDLSGSVIVVDGATLATHTVPTGAWPQQVAVNPVSGKAYATSRDGTVVTLIDEATLTTASIDVGGESYAVAVDPVANRVYVAGRTGGIAAITSAPSGATNHGVTLLDGPVFYASAPTTGLDICCAYAPNDPAIRAVYSRGGNGLGRFFAANDAGSLAVVPRFTTGLDSVMPGLNFVKTFSLDAMSGTSAKGDATTTGQPRVHAVVWQPVSFDTVRLPSGTRDIGYNGYIYATGGQGTLSYDDIGFDMPPGLTLSPSGWIYGTPYNSGFYRFRVTATDPAGHASDRFFVIYVSDPYTVRLGNLSTRAQVLTGNDVMIAGFIVGGSTPKRVVVNVAGPTLASYGIANALADPTLTLVRASDNTVIASNDNWPSQDVNDVADLQAVGFQPNDGREPAIIATLAPGAYTAIVQGAGGATGVGLVGVFDVDNAKSPLVNISARARVLTGNDVMIAGFVVQGASSQRVVINVAGPSLAQYGLDPLPNPQLTLVRASDNTIIATNDDWQTQTNPADVAAIQAAGFQPNHPLEPALIATLPPGAYTAIVQGVNGGTGVGLVGVFAAP